LFEDEEMGLDHIYELVVISIDVLAVVSPGGG